MGIMGTQWLQKLAKKLWIFASTFIYLTSCVLFKNISIKMLFLFSTGVKIVFITMCCRLFFDIFPVFQISQSVMEAALSPDMLATDLAYYLVRKGVSCVYIDLLPSKCCANC